MQVAYERTREGEANFIEKTDEKMKGFISKTEEKLQTHIEKSDENMQAYIAKTDDKMQAFISKSDEKMQQAVEDAMDMQMTLCCSFFLNRKTGRLRQSLDSGVFLSCFCACFTTGDTILRHSRLRTNCLVGLSLFSGTLQVYRTAWYAAFRRM